MKVSVVFGRSKFFGLFFFAKRTVIAHKYLGMLQMWLISQLYSSDLIFQKNGIPPHFHNDVRECLTESLPQCGEGDTDPGSKALFKWSLKYQTWIMEVS
ncbi:hypothetical protein HNY73_016663 [Argiope bruennichi]|uniref:Uncharacterized protein n=1 Tax=Argiope bruennichi TaxID=94029 RepID=A0A8T0EPG4_ARGBR|nr:hypothetical protein HNY73_016663 [Argiope bruennichi]